MISANESQFSEKTVVVTGGASGNGREIALQFARLGAEHIIVIDVRESPREGGTPTVDQITQVSQSKASFIKCDLSDNAQIANAVEYINDCGGADILINNAGVCWQRLLALESTESIDLMLAINVQAPILLSQHCAQAMAKRGGGAIINVSSGAAFASAPGYVLYSTTKAAIQGLTIGLAAELGHLNIRVNSVAPGRVRTAMTMNDLSTINPASGISDTTHIPLGRYGEPIDVANACTYLASSQASFITGASLVIDGGTAIFHGQQQPDKS